MSRISLLLTLPLVFCLSRDTDADVSDSATSFNLPLDLTDADFEVSIANGKTWVVMFYAPWCGHCKSAKPLWDKLARSAVLAEKDIQVARVDGSASGKESMKKWAVERASMSSFPSVLRFARNAKGETDVWAYTGERKATRLERFALKGEGEPIEPPGALMKLWVQVQGLGSQFVRFAGTQSVGMVVALVLALAMVVWCLGFLLGYYWREWQVGFYVNIRWGSKGDFVSMGLTPLDSGAVLVRKTKDGTVLQLNDTTQGEVFCRVGGQDFWLPSLQQLDPDAVPDSFKAEGKKTQ